MKTLIQNYQNLVSQIDNRIEVCNKKLSDARKEFGSMSSDEYLLETMELNTERQKLRAERQAYISVLADMRLLSH